MAIVRFKLSEVDQQKYQVPEWVELNTDQEALSKTPQTMGILEEFESSVKLYFNDGSFEKEANIPTLRATRATCWLACRLAGSPTPWPEFWPDQTSVETVIEGAEDGGQGNPPAAPNRAARRAAAKPSAS